MVEIENQVLVIFGASGDLTKRKLIPAVYNLYKRGFLPKKYAILGVSRTKFTDEEFRKAAILDNPHLKTDKKKDLKEFSNLVHYQTLDTADQKDYTILQERINNICDEKNIVHNFIFYLSTPPSLYTPISRSLASTGLQKEDNGFRRLIVEKPFGYDLKSAMALNAELLECFKESQIYRIDHYLGKETVQNLLVARFGNTIFEPVWNRNFIQRVEITNAESDGVGSRGGYYDGSGALRDMVQNHLLQLLALVAMEPPANMEPDSIRNEKVKLFQSLRPLTKANIKNSVIRGQYLGSVIDNEDIVGYREEKGVDKNSRTETFAALKFFIDNWRWEGVPFYIRTGKRLPTKVSEVVIYFQHNHYNLFKKSRLKRTQNILVFRIQPNEGILLKFGLKVPGAGFDVETVNMDFLYEELTDSYIPDAYERLILDCMQGDATLYARGDSVIAAWEFIDPIINEWKKDNSIPIYGYPAGTWGPEQIDQLIAGEEVWRNPCKNLIDDGIYCEL